MSVNYVALGKRIGYFRMQCGNITQEALASKINRSREFLAKIEKGTEHPSIATLVDIADALCISVDDLLIDSLGGPRRLIALAEMQTQLCTALQLSRSGGRHFLCIQTICDALITHAVDFPAKNVLHRFRCQFIYNQLGVIIRVFLVSIGCKTSHKITAFPLDRKLALDFDGNVPAVPRLSGSQRS